MEILRNIFKSEGLKGKTIKGVAWLGSLKIVSRAVSVLRIAIIARILAPAQFGLFGIAAIALALLETLTETGINVVLVQEKKDIDKYINTAWMVSIIRGFIISVIIFITAPLVARFFNDMQATSLLRLISIVPILRGFINPSVVKFQKELRFEKIFIINSSVVLVEAVGSVIFSYLTKSPAGLVYGIILGVIVEITLTFLLAHPTPSFSFDRNIFNKIVRRGKWVTGMGIFNYLTDQGDDAVVGRLLNTASLGLYQVAYRISMLPGTEVTGVVTNVTFPVYTKIANDKLRLRKAYFKTLIPVILITFPISILIFLFPKEIILLLLGDQWIKAVPVLKVLILLGFIVSINSTKNSVFLALNKQNKLFKLHVIRFVALAVLIIPLTLNFGIVGAALASLYSILFVTPMAIYYLYKLLY